VWYIPGQKRLIVVRPSVSVPVGPEVSAGWVMEDNSTVDENMDTESDEDMEVDSDTEIDDMRCKR
jgi:hypothetical protein